MHHDKLLPSNSVSRAAVAKRAGDVASNGHAGKATSHSGVCARISPPNVRERIVPTMVKAMAGTIPKRIVTASDTEATT